MRKSLTIIILLAATVCPAPGQQAGGSKRTAKDEQEVKDVMKALAEAGQKRDVAVIDRILADDYFHTNSDGSVMTREQVIASYKAPAKAKLDSNEHAEERLRVHGDTAVVSGTVTHKGREGDRHFVRTWRVTNVLSRRHGRWQIITSHASFIMQG